MIRQRKRQVSSGAAKLEMTPMIDVVFLLLIFFLVTLRHQDILARLSAVSPAPDPDAERDSQPPTIEIMVHHGGFVWRGRSVGIEPLRRDLKRLAAHTDQPLILIKVTTDSQHGRLVQVMDACYEAGLSNLAVFTL